MVRTAAEAYWSNVIDSKVRYALEGERGIRHAPALPQLSQRRRAAQGELHALTRMVLIGDQPDALDPLWTLALN